MVKSLSQTSDGTNPVAPERRAHPRIPLELELHGQPEDGGIVARMVSTNLSLGGLYCVSTADFPEMTRLAVRLLLPTHGTEPQPLDLEAVVVRREELASSSVGAPRYELALFFTNLADSDREVLSRALET